MDGKLINAQGQIIAVIKWRVETQQNSQVLDRFVDGNGNVYLERPHEEEINGLRLMLALQEGAKSFYPGQVLEVKFGR